MAYFYSLIRRAGLRVLVGVCIAVVMMFVHNYARAAFPSSPDANCVQRTDGACYLYSNDGGNSTTTTPEPWCIHAQTQNVAIYTQSQTYTRNADGTGICRETVVYKDSQYSQYNRDISTAVDYRYPYGVGRPSVQSCPANATISGTSCTCGTGYIQNPTNNGCVAGQTPQQLYVAGLNLTGAPLSYKGVPTLEACSNGVSIRGEGSACGGGYCELFGPFSAGTKDCSNPAPTSTGTASSLPVDTNAPPADCPKGTVAGNVNGAGTCYPITTGNTVQLGVSTAASAPVGTTSTGGVALGTNADGSAATGSNTVDKSTNCDANNCTTTSKITSSTGTGTPTVATTTKTEPKTNFCTDNPKSVLCAESRYGGGSCAAGVFTAPSCSGDAIACAAANSLGAIKCATDNPHLGEQAVYDAEKIKTGDQTKDLVGNQTIDARAAGAARADRLGPGQGAQDLTTTIMGRSFTLKLSTVNPFLQYLGYILLAITSILAMRIMTKSTE